MTLSLYLPTYKMFPCLGESMKQQLLILVEWAKYIPAFRQAGRLYQKTKQTLKGQGHEIEFKYFDKNG
jgi:hypothetical protein